MHPSNLHEDVHALEAPDYVAVVIEWDDNQDDVRTLVHQRALHRAPLLTRTLATALGALGAIALTTLGLRLLRQA